jgi:hypothetical protein
MDRTFKNLESSTLLTFDGLQAVAWFVNMTSNITSPRITNVSPGEFYTFVFSQDGKGHHFINWPSNAMNAAPIDPRPNSTTIQHFIGSTGDLLYANIATTRTP